MGWIDYIQDQLRVKVQLCLFDQKKRETSFSVTE